MTFPLILIIGPPRSGTTWLQSMLSSCPGIVSVQETGLFSNYLSFLDKQWVFESQRKEERNVGLSNILTREEFLCLCRNFSENVFDKIADLKSSEKNVQYILEKTPHNSFYIDFIIEMFPDAHIIHLVRDPRSVCASLQAASKGWGEAWAPSSSAGAARLWNKSSSTVVSSNVKNLIRVFYEDLKVDANKEVEKIFNWLGISYNEESMIKIIEKNNFNNLKKTKKTSFNNVDEPEGFFRSGKVDGWKNELTNTDVKIVEYICRDLMEEFGYDFFFSTENKPIRLKVREIMEGLDWRSSRLINKVIKKL